MGSGTDIAIDAADIIILNNRLANIVEAREISRYGYRKMVQNVSLAFLFNGIGVPLAATGLLYPVWAMIAMAASVRSDEHTSALQSLMRNSYAVFCWKKKSYQRQEKQTEQH